MKIKDIEIKDFRGFGSFKCSFTPGVNVIIGRNGAGKTTLIHAIHKAMSFIFPTVARWVKTFFRKEIVL